MGSSSKQLCFDLPVLREWRRAPPEVGGPEYYLAILPSEEVAQRASLFADRLHREYAFPVKPRDWTLMHVSACGLGRYDEPADVVLAAVDQAIGAIRMEPFVLVLDCVMSFKTPEKHIVLAGEQGRDQFRMLHVKLAKSLRLACFRVKYSSALQPHATLFYQGRDIETQDLAEPFRIEVNQVVLVQSLVGTATHVHIGSWSLRSN
jgi:RNA 2',3'-cyclic 3'-phosphodiesterase